MPDITFANGRNGNVSGIVGTSAQFNLKVEKFLLAHVRPQADTSGFGDKGDTYSVDKPSSWSFSVGGWLLTSGTAGISTLSGTVSAYGTVTLTADNGRIYYGSCRITNNNITTVYTGGNVPFIIQGRGQGPLNET